MRAKKARMAVLLCLLLLCACDYIVLPEEDATPISRMSKGWTGVVTHIGTSDAGDLHIDIAIRNETADWSAVRTVPNKPAVLTTSDGKTTNCDTVFVGTGGHRLAPGFQMRGYVTGTKAEPQTQPLYVECPGTPETSGAKLSIDISYVTGEYNYYYQDATRTDSKLELSLNQVVADLQYPITEPIDGLIQKPGTEITAINDCLLTLIDASRTDTGLKFTWQTSNPGEYPTYVHIGIPPVIGADGILYGLYESPDIVSPPITPAGQTAQWTTEVAVPPDDHGLYILLSVESKKQRLFVNYAIDITDK